MRPDSAMPDGRHDHGRAAQLVQLLRVGHVADVADERKVEELRLARDELLAVVEDLGMDAEHGRRVDRQRAVHEDRNLGNALAR